MGVESMLVGRIQDSVLSLSETYMQRLFFKLSVVEGHRL